MATRDELHRVVSSLPEDTLEVAHTFLTQLQAGRSPQQAAALEQFTEAQQRVHDRMQERMRAMVELLARRPSEQRGERHSMLRRRADPVTQEHGVGQR